MVPIFQADHPVQSIKEALDVGDRLFSCNEKLCFQFLFIYVNNNKYDKLHIDYTWPELPLPTTAKHFLPNKKDWSTAS
ncbi:hypothetical protein T02_341 [Trichinella nativa]|uniref:Uncharacterized protein n=1 Tax=Trichinella nativa TaxID=6335 RepID=A0A0V1LLD1_9BILA|nr:hypothetical protein T06_2762 [Trichinella sp. T6]KRZ60331.1 hypothetical protein T02_341 [Trichinella nativa]